jgi:hypothetical protein
MNRKTAEIIAEIIHDLVDLVMSILRIAFSLTVVCMFLAGTAKLCKYFYGLL